MKAYLIDAKARDVREVQIDGFKDFAGTLGCDYIEVAARFGEDVLYVDEEKWLDRSEVERRMRGRPASTATTFNANGRVHTETLVAWDEILGISKPRGGQ